MRRPIFVHQARLVATIYLYKENDLTTVQPEPRQVLHRILSGYTPVTNEAVDHVLASGQIESYSKNRIIFHEQRFNAFEYFQLEGVSHRFNADGDKQTITTGIYQGEAVVTPHMARTKGSQSIFSLQALTDCVYLQVPAGLFRTLMNDHSVIRSFGQAVVEREFAQHLNFEVLFRTQSARERLLYFREQYPNLENLIPHTVIASFLGITPVSFSRLRSELIP